MIKIFLKFKALDSSILHIRELQRGKRDEFQVQKNAFEDCIKSFCNFIKIDKDEIFISISKKMNSNIITQQANDDFLNSLNILNTKNFNNITEKDILESFEICVQHLKFMSIFFQELLKEKYSAEFQEYVQKVKDANLIEFQNFETSVEFTTFINEFCKAKEINKDILMKELVILISNNPKSNDLKFMLINRGNNNLESSINIQLSKTINELNLNIINESFQSLIENNVNYALKYKEYIMENNVISQDQEDNDLIYQRYIEKEIDEKNSIDGIIFENSKKPPKINLIITEIKKHKNICICLCLVIIAGFLI